jgi:hypothetical protein
MHRARPPALDPDSAWPGTAMPMQGEHRACATSLPGWMVLCLDSQVEMAFLLPVPGRTALDG